MISTLRKLKQIKEAIEKEKLSHLKVGESQYNPTVLQMIDTVISETETNIEKYIKALEK